MTSERTMNFAIDGTSALQLPKPHLIVFPGSNDRVSASVRSSRTNEDLANHPRRSMRIPDILARSEMFCSLLFEDYRGCSYGIFTQRGIVAITAAIAAIAIVSLVFGC